MKKSFIILAAIMLSVVSAKAQNTFESNAYQVENFADAETLDATFLKTSPRIYDYRNQAKAKRKYAQKILKKIEKTINKI